MRDLGALILRAVTGSLMIGHGTQKLFGWFGGQGPKGTAMWIEQLGLRPGERWAKLAGAGEAGGGLLTLLGLFNPLGPISMAAVMAMATAKVHWGKPVWVTSGGPELPLTNMAIAGSLIATGPGRYSLDHLLGIRMPVWLAATFAGLTAGGVALGIMSQPQEAAQPEQQVTEQQVEEIGVRPEGEVEVIEEVRSRPVEPASE